MGRGAESPVGPFLKEKEKEIGHGPRKIKNIFRPGTPGYPGSKGFLSGEVRSCGPRFPHSFYLNTVWDSRCRPLRLVAKICTVSQYPIQARAQLERVNVVVLIQHI